MSNLHVALALIAKNGDLIEEVLLAGHVFGDENSERALNALTSHKVMVTDGMGKFKLSRQWRSALETSLGSRAEYSAQSSVIGGDILSIIGICEAIAAAGTAAASRSVELLPESENLIWGIRESVLGFLDTIEEQIRIRFRDEEDHDVRVQRNKSYITSVRGLMDMLDGLQGRNLMDALDMAGCDEIRREYHDIVFSSIPSFSDRSQALILDLQNMLIHNTRIAAESKRRIAIIKALSGVTKAELRAVVSEDPESFLTYPKFDFSPLVDVADPDTREERLAAAVRMKLPEAREPKVIPKPTPFMEIDVSALCMTTPGLDLIHAFDQEVIETGEVRVSEFVHRTDESALSKEEMFFVLMHQALSSDLYEISIFPTPSRITTSRIDDILARPA